LKDNSISPKKPSLEKSGGGFFRFKTNKTLCYAWVFPVSFTSLYFYSKMRINDGLDRKERLVEYTKLGNTDIKVSKLCVGCMSFGQAGLMHNWTLDKNQTEEMIKHALDLGINFFDTANCYSAGTSEEYVGTTLKNNVDRDKVVIASKVYFNDGRLSKEAINREIDGTLKRLGTEYLDLYIIHRFD
jgi:hypothetical protein